MITFLKRKISNKNKYKIKMLLNKFRALFVHNNLTKLAIIFRTDKWGSHYYTPHYQQHFKKFKNKRNNILEIGVGGYDNPNSGGHSLRMWKQYFRKSNIVSFDIYDKLSLQEKRIKIYKGSQIDASFLELVCNKSGPFDIIIDDGSHINCHVIKTFEILFPKLKKGGIYVIEDTQTSYWPDMGGSLKERNDKSTIYGYFKNLIDGLNYKEYLDPSYKPSYFDLNIVSIHFYHNMIFIHKNDNLENSNVVENGVRKF